MLIKCCLKGVDKELVFLRVWTLEMLIDGINEETNVSMKLSIVSI